LKGTWFCGRDKSALEIGSALRKPGVAQGRRREHVRIVPMPERWPFATLAGTKLDDPGGLELFFVASRLALMPEL